MSKITKPCANCDHASIHSDIPGIGCTAPISAPQEPTKWCPCTTYVEPAKPAPAPRPAKARRTDPDTSHAAAASLTVDTLRASQAAVLAFIKAQGPLTDVDLVEAYSTTPRSDGTMPPRQSPSGLRSRRAELVAGGLVEDTGKRVRLESGRQAIVWAAKA